jgi:hypothetical protein
MSNEAARSPLGAMAGAIRQVELEPLRLANEAKR